MISSVEASIGKLATALVGQLAKGWFAGKKADSRRGQDLTALLRARFPLPRKQERELLSTLQDVEDEVAARLAPVCERLAHGLPENEVTAALDAVTDTLEDANLSNEVLFGVDLDPTLLHAVIRREYPLAASRAGLGDRATELYDSGLRRACVVLVHLAKELPEFPGTAAVEDLRRLTSISAKLDRVLEHLSDAAPKPADRDVWFRRQYLAHVVSTLDRLELLGLDMRHKPRLALSTAYLSLSVTGGDPRGRKRDHRESLRFWKDQRPDTYVGGTMRIESALEGVSRILIRGDAGSGKTTLLDWIAITAAQESFTEKLAAWNGNVPFSIRLRGFASGSLPTPEDFLAHSVQMLAGDQPEGWVRRCLKSGRALVLVDGVDEVPLTRRRAVRTWLRELCTLFPDAKFVVTSRLAAAKADWLTEEGFTSVQLEQMSPGDITAFLERWHEAAKQAKSLPCAPDDLPEARRRLQQQLDSRSHLASLATTPLLCAMLCALNLERTSELPANRMDLYRNALNMLLHLRDTERGISSLLDTTSKTAILRDLAWRLTLGNRAEVSTEKMLAHVAVKLPQMPNVDVTAEKATEHLLDRSGVVREPAPGRVDFVHRTFQEYLAAQEAVQDNQIETLVSHAHLDSWWETVVMACGHATRVQLKELLTDLLDRADAVPEHARHLRLLSAACLETVTEVDPAVSARCDEVIREHLVPPKSIRETRSLATVGHRVLRYLPEELLDLSPAVARATVRVAWQTGNPEVLTRLARYAQDPRGEVQSELIKAWNYFEPERYAEVVLADAPLLGGSIIVNMPNQISHLKKLTRLTEVNVLLMEKVSNLSVFEEVPHLRGLSTRAEGKIDLSPLLLHSELRFILIHSAARYTGMHCIGRMRALRRLGLFRGGGNEWLNLNFLKHCTGVRFVMLNQLGRIADYRALGGLELLDELTLYEGFMPEGFVNFPRGSGLSELDLSMFKEGSTLDGIQEFAPTLRSLTVNSWEVTSLDPLKDFSRIKMVRIIYCKEPWDLTPLSGMSLNLMLDHSVKHVGLDSLGPDVKISYTGRR